MISLREIDSLEADFSTKSRPPAPSRKWGGGGVVQCPASTGMTRGEVVVIIFLRLGYLRTIKFKINTMSLILRAKLKNTHADKVKSPC